MWSKELLRYADIASVYISLGVLALLVWRKEVKRYAFLAVFLCLRSVTDVLSLAFLFHRRELNLTPQQAYNGYFYTYWPLAVLQLVFQLLIIFSVYRIAMRPLDGLKKIGTVIFAWVATVSIVLSIMVALGPHMQGSDATATLFSQAQQGVSILTVCLLVFVCFAARPLGLDFRSRGFGVALGLGVNSTVGLVLSAWLASSSAHSLYAPIFSIGAVAGAMSTVIWGAYFALPEPEQKMILLPTTSPYFLWNSISEALGDAPGVVAVAGFTPSMLAPAEMAALTAAATPAEVFSFQPSAAPAIASGF